MTSAIIIPARLASTRFPRKVLAPINGKPMLLWTVEAALRSCADDVYVASADEEILTLCHELNVPAIETRSDHRTGTDRVAEAAAGLSHDFIVNLQADEPAVAPSVIDRLVTDLVDSEADMASLMSPMSHPDDLTNPHRVKVVSTQTQRALYFSRAPIPATQPAKEVHGAHFIHIGIYAFRRSRLLEFTELMPTPLETLESLEQLRALENGWHIHMSLTDWESTPVDVIEDLEIVSLKLGGAEGT